MTNREYMEKLSNLDFSRFLFSEVLPAGKEYNDSILGIADWLGRDRYFDESDMYEVIESRCGSMNDSIIIQMAIDDIREYKVEPCRLCDESEIKGFNDGLDTAISALATIPSANKKGKWIKTGNKKEKEPRKIWWFECSECGFRLTDSIDRSVYNYCPRCGLKMESIE